VSERRRRRVRIALEVLGIVLALVAIGVTVAPVFIHTRTYGVHDWDQMQAHRYLAVKTLLRFHEFPFWNPYSCGGHTWWGGLESGSSLVSPMLPFYLLLPFAWALRLEVIVAAVISGAGTWFFAGRFTRSPALRVIAVAAFSINGRFGFQAGAGHTWHLYYAWMPWALFFLDRAIGLAPSYDPPKRFPLRDVTLLGAAIAMLVYTGAIYPVPQTIAVVALYAIGCAIASRSLRPIGLAMLGGVLSFAFAAPRLLPVVDMLRRYPRLVDSPEALDLSGLIAVFTVKEADHHPTLSPWGWHEWSIYTGWIPFVMMVLALVLAARARERALRLAGVVCLVLGMGRFHDDAPWALAHDYLPIFESQHVPSRWLYPAALVLIVLAASIIERFLARQERRAWFEVALLLVAGYVAINISLESQRPLVGAFVRRLEPIKESTTDFHQEKVAPPSLRYDESDWAPPAMPAMIANVGVLDCNTFPGFNSYYRDKHNHTPGMGAVARGDPSYLGEAFTVSKQGEVKIESWSPNSVTVSVHGGKPGDLLVLNQNWDPGWHARGPVIDYRSTVATALESADEVVTFGYTPRFFFVGCLLFVLAVCALVWVSRARRRML
jgi:hypothetical protein